MILPAGFDTDAWDWSRPEDELVEEILAKHPGGFEEDYLRALIGVFRSGQMVD